MIKKINVVKTSILLKLIHRFNAIPSKIPTKFLVDIDKLTLKFTWKGTGPRRAKREFYFIRKSKVGRIGLLD